MTSNLTPRPGDASGPYPRNNSEHVTAIIYGIQNGNEVYLSLKQVFNSINAIKDSEQIPECIPNDVGKLFGHLFEMAGEKGYDDNIRVESLKLAGNLYNTTMRALDLWWYKNSNSSNKETACELKNKLEHDGGKWKDIGENLRMSTDWNELMRSMPHRWKAIREKMDDEIAAASNGTAESEDSSVSNPLISLEGAS